MDNVNTQRLIATDEHATQFLMEYIEKCNRESDTPSIDGYVVFLWFDHRIRITRETLWAYSKQYPMFGELLKWFNSYCRQFYQRNGLTGELKEGMCKFLLENAYGMKTPNEIELGEKTRESLNLSNMSMADKLALIKEAVKDDD